MDQVRQVLPYHHYAYRTEQTYCDWIVRYIRYHGSKTHPRDMGKVDNSDVPAYLRGNQPVRRAVNRVGF